MAEKKPRLGAADWIAAGLVALAEGRAERLGAEPLARGLGTTKGSFYWHFRDVAAFRAAVLAAWAERARGVISAEVGDEAMTARLLRIARPDPAEAAVRELARHDAAARAVLGDVDALREAALARALQAIGLGNPDFVVLVQACVIGMEALDRRDALSTLLAAILALQEA